MSVLWRIAKYLKPYLVMMLAAALLLALSGALMAMDGHMARANQYLLYQHYGPAGPDGLVGTADDVGNVIAE